MIPVVGSLPVIGNLFGYRNENTTKSELVIFLRPQVVKNASINGDYKEFRSHLPDNMPLGKTPYGDTPPAPTTPSNSTGTRGGT